MREARELAEKGSGRARALERASAPWSERARLSRAGRTQRRISSNPVWRGLFNTPPDATTPDTTCTVVILDETNTNVKSGEGGIVVIVVADRLKFARYRCDHAAGGREVDDAKVISTVQRCPEVGG